jgi:hypothetical protein
MPMQAPSANGQRAAGSALSTPLPTRHRPPGYAALAVLLIVGLGALGYYFYTAAGSKVPVVMAVHAIPAGHTIERSDLTTIDVAGRVTAVAGANLPSLVGQVAAVEILPNTLIQRAMVTTAQPLGAGQALVGVAAAPGQMPSLGLRPGDTVQVLVLPPKGTTGQPSSVSPVLAEAAVVYDVRANPAQAGGALLTLLVPKAAAYGIVSASNSGLIALVKVGG